MMLRKGMKVIRIQWKSERKKYKKEKNELERQLEKKTNENKKAGDKSKEQLDAKDKMLNELAKKNEDLEDKITSLLDLFINMGAMIVGVMGITVNVTIWKEMMFNYLLLLTRMSLANRHLHLQWHHV